MHLLTRVDKSRLRAMDGKQVVDFFTQHFKVSSEIGDIGDPIAVAQMLFKAAVAQGMPTRQAAQLINTMSLARLTHPHLSYHAARSRVYHALRRHYAEKWGPGQTPYSFLREQLIQEDNSNRQLNSAEAEDRGLDVTYSTRDFERGVRFKENSLKTYFLLGLMAVDGSYREGRRFLLSGKSEDLEFYTTIVAPLFSNEFGIDVQAESTQRKSGTYRVFLRTRSQALEDFFDEFDLIKPIETEKGIVYKFRLQGSRLEAKTRADLRTDHYIAYTMGMVAGSGNVDRPTGRLPRMVFADSRGAYLDELLWAFDQTPELNSQMFSRRGKGAKLLSATKTLALASMTTPYIFPDQQGYWVHKKHLDVVNELVSRNS